MIATLASEAWSRWATAGAAKPEKIGTWIAPMWAQACDAIATSCDIGRKIATRSPCSTPSRTSASASRVTWSDMAAQVSSRRAPSSASDTAATASGRRRAHRCTQFQAMFTSPPTNQVAHSGPRERSKTRSHGFENSRPMSSTAAAQNQSGSSCERRTSSQ